MSWLDPVRHRRASAYGAGPRLDQALDICARLARVGLTAAIGYAASPDEPTHAVANIHQAAIERIAAEARDVYIAVKLSGIGFDAGLLAALATAAQGSAARLHIDALTPETADATSRLLERLPDADQLGRTLPGRWRRSVADASRIVELGVPVRIVKGHWADPSAEDIDPVEGFLGIVHRLRDHRGEVRVATHDVSLLDESLRRLTERGTRCSAELLLGLPFHGPAQVARQHGVPIRIYVPFGNAGAPYAISDVIHHPAAARWLAQDLLFGQTKFWRGLGRSSPGL